MDLVFASCVAHPRFRDLNRVVETAGPVSRLRLEDAYQGSGPYGLATVIFALALYATAATLGWPASDEIEAVFERHPWS